MNPRTTGLLFVVGAALAAFLYFYEIRGEEGRREADEAETRLFADLDPAALDWIELRTSDAHDARVERVDGAWRVVAPIAVSADPVVMDAFADALVNLRSTATIADAQDDSVYRLDDAAQSVRFGVGAATHRVRVGRPTPIDANHYVKTDDRPEVFTVESFRVKGFERTLTALRERRPIRFDRERIDRIEVSWRDEGVVLEKKDGGWQLVEPRAERADDVAVDTLLADLSFLRADNFADDAPPEKTGLDDPDYRVVLRAAGGEGEAPITHEVIFGAPMDGATRAARGAEDSVYKIPDDRYQDLPRALGAFRYKQLTDYLAADVMSFELLLRDPEDGSVKAVALRGERDSGGFTTQPEPMKAGSAERMVNAFASLRAKTIIADRMGDKERKALDLFPPAASLRLYGGEAAGGALLGELDVGTIAAGVLYAQVPGRDFVYGLDAAMAEDLPVNLQAFRNRFASDQDADSEDVDAVEVEVAP